MDNNTQFARRPPWGLKFLWRSASDFVTSMQRLHSPMPCVTVFGSARLREQDPAYQTGIELGRALGDAGFAVLTGGGPGLMEAANRGARESGAHSLGCRMAFTFEQASNRYMDRAATVRHFFIRKVVMCRLAVGFAVLPGGIGTLDELFEILALIQTKRMEPKSIILIGQSYWHPLLGLLEQMVASGTVSYTDISLIKVTDDVSHAVSLLTASVAGTSRTSPKLQASASLSEPEPGAIRES